jgi:FtsP/CotA-like multicopper oxidase with cupredoxin domain
MVTRRDLIKMGIVGSSGFVLLPPGGGFGRVSRFFDNNQGSSPRLTPFVDPLPTFEELRLRASQFAPSEISEYARPYYGPGPDGTKCFEIAMVERNVKFHRDLPLTSAWTYVDRNNPPGSSNQQLITFSYPKIVLGQPEGAGFLVRYHNDLTTAPRDFGFPTMTVHFHGGHQPAPADGFPHNISNRPPGFPDPITIAPGNHFDYMYPFIDVGVFDPPFQALPEERPSFYWFHDHFLDFTGPNVYRGLANVAPAFDEIDSDDENDTQAHALKLPSGPYDLPLVLQDKTFDISGALIFDPFDQDGHIGDTMIVNGVVQPRHEVKRRKYRLRFLDGSNARIYEIFLTNDLGQTFPMTQIATEGGLLVRPIKDVRSFTLYMAQRVEVVVDFGDPIFNGQQAIYIENRMAQSKGRKPDGVGSRGTKLVKFILGDKPKDDPSQVPSTLRSCDPIPQSVLNAAEHKSFEFNRSHGVFTVNGVPVDIEKPVALVKRNRPQLWHFKNSSGGWWHPNHVHSEFMRVLRRNGRTPPLNEIDGNARKDTVLMRGGESIDVFIIFRDYSGPFVSHCHNLEHEDMAMMGRFDVVD